MKKWSFVVAVMIFFGLAAVVYAGEIPSSHDFESYTGGVPTGWEGNNGSFIEKVDVDEQHGIALGLHNIGADKKPELRYAIPTVDEGRFLLSFEICAKDVNKNLRITLESPSSGSIWHSIFYMNTSGEMCAWMNTTGGGWDTQKMLSYELDRWYKVDILLDMDNKVMKYYVDGDYYASSTISFYDFSRIFFRIENGVENTEGYTYLDNVSFKYITAEGMTLFLENEAVIAGDDMVQVNFSDIIATTTLNKLTAYSMGNNPIEYTKTPIGCTVISKDNSKAVIKFDDSLKEDTIYKIEIPGLTSVYGDEYVNNSVYFATNKSKSDKKVVNADFSTAEIGSKVAPKTDAEWTKNSSYVRVALVNDLDDKGTGIPAVRFFRGNSEMLIRRDFEPAFDGRLVFEYKMKAETPTQIFKLYDSFGECRDLVTVKPEGIYYGENKLCEYISDWITVSIELKKPENKVVFYINGEQKGEYEYDSVADIKAVEFVQKNIEGASGDDRAKTDIAYFTMSALMPNVGVNLITFEGSDGQIYYPDDKIMPKISKIRVKFSDSVNPHDDSVKLIVDGDEEFFTGDYDYIDKEYTMTLPQYLQGDSSYTIKINGVQDSSGAEITPISGVFVTEPGVFVCEEMEIGFLGQNVNINTEITHTNACYEDMYLIYAAYKGDFMLDFKVEKITPSEGQRKISVSKIHTPPADADTVRAFVWDGFYTRHPIAEVKSVLCE